MFHLAQQQFLKAAQFIGLNDNIRQGQVNPRSVSVTVLPREYRA